jgi:hypothetical protein
MSQAPRLWRLARPIAAIATLLLIVAGLLAPTATAQTGGGYPPPGGPIGSISGRVVDAETGLPIQASVTLIRCDDFGCAFAGSQFAFDQGQFRFESQPFAVLPSGAYYIVASAFQYEEVQTATFLVADGENFSIGDIALPLIRSIGSISGRVINSQTGQPVTSFFPDNASLTLYFCSDLATCSPVGGTLLNSDGTFEILGSVFTPFRPGLYSVEITSPNYLTLRTQPVQIDANEHRNLGDLALTPTPTIRSISGRLVDSVTGGPVPGGTDPFSSVALYRCESFGCFFTVAITSADASGRFRFDSSTVGSPLVAGNYQIVANADQYGSTTSAIFSTEADQDVDLGDVKIQPYPVRFSNAQGCETIPATGGTCRYSVRVTSGMPTILDVASWNVITAISFAPPTSPNSGGISVFQPELARNLRLKPGQSQVLRYELRVPAGAANGTFMCATAYVSKDRTTRLFNTIGQRQLFCVAKVDTGPFQRMTEQEIRDMEREGRGPRRP